MVDNFVQNLFDSFSSKFSVQIRDFRSMIDPEFQKEKNPIKKTRFHDSDIKKNK